LLKINKTITIEIITPKKIKILALGIYGYFILKYYIKQFKQLQLSKFKIFFKKIMQKEIKNLIEKAKSAQVR